MSVDNIYPDLSQQTLNQVSEQAPAYQKPFNPAFTEQTSDVHSAYVTRNEYMVEKINEIKKDLIHYKKIKTRWNNADSTLKIIGISLTCVGSIATVVTTTPIGLLTVVPIILGSATGIQSFINGVLITSLTNKKKSAYREKIEYINSYLNKLFIFMEKAKNDNDITMEELKIFQKICKEYQNGLTGGFLQKPLESEKKENNYSKKEIKLAKNLVKEKRVKKLAEAMIEAM